MNTKIFNWKEEIKKDELEEVKKVIENDGLVIFPTDTVYGLACNSFSEVALNKIFKIKERDINKPINVLTDSSKKINQVVEKISKKEEELMSKYFPGALTIIFDKKKNVPDILTANLKTVGVRIPNNEIALEILKMFDYPLAVTSANPSGEESGIKVEDYIDYFKGKVNIIIDGGESNLKVASTIVRVEEDDVKVLRQGTIKI